MVKIDYSMLYLKSENARMRLKEVSRALRKSSQRLKYNLDMLEKEEIIKNPYCVFDYSFFGLILFRIYLRGVYVADHDKKKIINELSNNPYIVSIYELTGEYDLVVEFASPNPSKFNKELKKIVNIMPNLNDYKIILNIVTHIYPRHYLTKSISKTADSRISRIGKNRVARSTKKIIVSNIVEEMIDTKISDYQPQYIEKVIGGDREWELFTENEMKVMKSLLIYPTSRLSKLAKYSELNVKTIKSILKNLAKRNVVRGFKYILDKDKLGIHAFRLFLKLHHITQERETSLMNYLRNSREIIQTNKTVGDWDLEVDIESIDSGKIRQIILQIREEFKDIIERFNLIEFHDSYKKSYLPAYLFKDSI